MGPAGLRVLVTAEQRTSALLARHLDRAGLDPVVLPCIRVLPPADPAPLAEAMGRILGFRWVVVTSANGARALGEGLGGAAWPGRTRLAAVGPATARALAGHGLAADLVPDEATSVALASALGGAGLDGQPVLLIQGSLAGEELERSLSADGARVTRVEAYRTVEGPEDPEAARRLFTVAPLAAVTLMSGSAARGLASATGLPALEATPLACVGPATAGVVRALGLRPAVVASPHNVEGLTRAVVELVGRSGGSS